MRRRVHLAQGRREAESCMRNLSSPTSFHLGGKTAGGPVFPPRGKVWPHQTTRHRRHSVRSSPSLARRSHALFQAAYSEALQRCSLSDKQTVLPTTRLHCPA